MELFEKMRGLCEIRGERVEILMLRHKKGKQKQGVLTPFRCQSSSGCPRESFCRFVNPLTTRLPVNFGPDSTGAEAS